MSHGVLCPFLFLALAMLTTAFAQAETLPVKAIADASLSMFRTPASFVLRAAEKMPEEKYSFRPTPEVRSFGELLGHIADGYSLVCGVAMGRKPPAEIQQTEKTRRTKTELIEALTGASETCEQAHTALSGPKGAEIVDFFGTKYNAVLLLFFNTSHTWEHYGNVVTYLRLQGIVPPSSEPRSRP